jgi:nitrogenase iron protein NifH
MSGWIIQPINNWQSEEKRLRGIAFYGKGGIGKSTALSNVTAALSSSGKKILQIGCDPKHDSTRLILGGFTQSTVLEQLNTTGRVSLNSVMLTGCNGIRCIESGGPEPGVGCAGRGIIQMLNLLKEQGLDTKQFDYVFFDVLGDVVCGGFAVPMREGYADEVYIVTSGEIASIYAANNIAKGLKRFSTSRGKLGGIIGNGRGTRNEHDVVAAFARLIGTEMVAFVPKSELIMQAEFESKTIMEFAPNSELAAIFQSIAKHIEQRKTPVVPKPLTDKELDNFLRQYCYNLKSPSQTSLTSQPKIDLPPAMQNLTPLSLGQKEGFPDNCKASSNPREPVQGCSLAGAYAAVRRIKDAIAIMHAPRGCAYVSFSGHLSHDASLPLDERFPPNLICTNMQETDVIFGGTQLLKDAAEKIHKKFPSHTIFVITSCPAGIIGDDINQVVEDLKADGIQACYIPTDGVMNNGDFYTGMYNAYCVLAESFIDNTIHADGDSVNIIGQPTAYPVGDKKSDTLDYIFEKLNIKVNCRFTNDTTIDAIRGFKKAKVSIPFSHDPLVEDLTNFLKTHFSIEILNAPLPIGFEETAEFARALGKRFDKTSEAEALIAEARVDYERRLPKLREYFSGKKTLIFSSPHNINWAISTLMDLGVEITEIYCSSFFSPREAFSSKYLSKIKVINDYPIDKFEQTVTREKPDFVLTAGNINAFNTIPYDILPTAAIPFLPSYGFNSGLLYADRLYSKLKFPSIEGWRNDKKLFQCS